MVSTRNLSAIPSISELRSLTQSLAMLDAIIQRAWQGRYFSFNSKWDKDEQMASMRNGEGDSWFCVFGQKGAFLKGFGHDTTMARNLEGNCVWPGVLGDIPQEFAAYATEPAFLMNDTTFCIWRTLTDRRWHTGTITYPEGNDPDGSARLLAIFDALPRTYQAWAEGYYRRSVSLSLVESIYIHRPLTESIVQGLNPSASLDQLWDDATEIDYPISRN
jgi:hypothetical protein